MTDAVVYVDGSGSATGGPGGVGYVATVDGADYEGSLSLPSATNQQAEILAAAWALDQLQPCTAVAVFSDSEYVVKGMTVWLDGWIRRGWRTKGGSPVKNRPHWERLIRARGRHDAVTFTWVRGHNGTAGNERADVLADEARRRQIDTDEGMTLPAA